MKLLIKNGRLFDPATGLDQQGSLAIADGRIVAVAEGTKDFSAEKEIEATGKLVCPGIVDLCARLREPGQEHKGSIASEARAAIQSGITSVCCPPDTNPPIDTPAVAELIQQRAEAVDVLRIRPLAALTKRLRGENLAEMLALKNAGCVGVSNAKQAIIETDILRNAMEYAHSCNMTVFIEAEDSYLGGKGVAHEGAISTRLGLSPIPVAAETVAIGTALLLAKQIGCRIHIGRVSSAAGIEMISEARNAGVNVTTDVAICNLHLTEMDVDGYRSECHVKPPLRTQADRESLCRAVENGNVDVICSNHEPHDDDAKAAPFAETEAGASTIELLLPLALELVQRGEISLEQAIRSLTSNPAKILGIDAGSLNKNAQADISIIDLQAHHGVERSQLASAGKNTPFQGWELRGQVSHTIYNGKIVFERS